jgi:hypothetical protein
MPTVRPRRAASAVLAAAALAAAAALPAAATAADAPRLIKAHRINSVTCVPGAANTVRAEVRLWMSVVNYDGWADWADHMEAKARLEATTAGISPHGTWVKWKTPYLLQNKRHLYNIRLRTDNKSGTAAWRLHVKLIWHRTAPTPNVTKDVYLPFNASCAPFTGAVGMSRPAAPAPAITNGG